MLVDAQIASADTDKRIQFFVILSISHRRFSPETSRPCPGPDDDKPSTRHYHRSLKFGCHVEALRQHTLAVDAPLDKVDGMIRLG
jgi:hypothetical protein